MSKYRVIEISKHQLQDLVRQAPELIEPGLKYVDHQTYTTRGPIDLIFVDSGHAMVIAELTVVEDDSMLIQVIDYYDYVLNNLTGFARAYEQHTIDTKQQPRLLLLAPNFSVNLLNRIKWIDIPISLFEYQCIELSDSKGSMLPVFKEVHAPDFPGAQKVYTLEDRFNYITDSKIRELARNYVAEFQTWDSQRVTIEPTKSRISIKKSGRVVSYIRPRRKYFFISINEADGNWHSYLIKSESDLGRIKSLVRESFIRMG